MKLKSFLTTLIYQALGIRNVGGVHIVPTGSATGYGDWLRACADAGKPVGLISSFEHAGACMEAKSISPQTVTILRRLAPGTIADSDTPPGNWRFDPQVMARNWLAALTPIWERDRGVVDYFCLMNEPDPSDDAAMAVATEFQIACMQIAETAGYKVAVWGWTAGLPRFNTRQAELSLPVLKYAAEHGHILSIHEGSLDPTRPTFEQATQDGTAFVYRKLEGIMGARGWPMPKVAITEMYMRAKSPLWDSLQWYLLGLARDGILGGAWFTAGDYGNQNMSGHFPCYAQMLAGIDWPMPPTPEPTPIPPTPAPGCVPGTVKAIARMLRL